MMKYPGGGGGGVRDSRQCGAHVFYTVRSSSVANDYDIRVVQNVSYGCPDYYLLLYQTCNCVWWIHFVQYMYMFRLAQNSQI